MLISTLVHQSSDVYTLSNIYLQTDSVKSQLTNAKEQEEVTFELKAMSGQLHTQRHVVPAGHIQNYIHSEITVYCENRW